VTREEFNSWAESPATRWVFRAIVRASELQKEEWDRVSWQDGSADPLVLHTLRTRADAYLGLIETPYERLCELNGEEPEEEA
jgi:hypothetical protein